MSLCLGPHAQVCCGATKFLAFTSASVWLFSASSTFSREWWVHLWQPVALCSPEWARAQGWLWSNGLFVISLQELAVPVVHDGGALLAFICGVVYTLLQSIISYKSCPQWNSLSTCHIRMAISAVSCAAVIPSILSASVGVLVNLTLPTFPQKAWKKQGLAAMFPHASAELGEVRKSLRK